MTPSHRAVFAFAASLPAMLCLLCLLTQLEILPTLDIQVGISPRKTSLAPRLGQDPIYALTAPSADIEGNVTSACNPGVQSPSSPEQGRLSRIHASAQD